MPDIKVRVLYFAQAREAAGTSQEELVLSNPADLEKVLSEIVRIHPQLSKIRNNVRTAVNLQLTDGNVVIEDGDEVAFLPPVVGG